jgi:hypothetical protein
MFGFESGMHNPFLELSESLGLLNIYSAARKSSTFLTIWSTLKLAGGCRGGNSFNASTSVEAEAEVVGLDHQDVRFAIWHGTPFAQPRPKQLCGMTLFGVRSGLGRFGKLSVKIHGSVESWSAVIVSSS